MSQFPLPKGYQRMDAFPLDATSIFTSLVDLEAYASTNGAAYAGQICSVNNGVDVTVYKINVDKSVTAIDAGGGSMDFGEF